MLIVGLELEAQARESRALTSCIAMLVKVTIWKENYSPLISHYISGKKSPRWDIKVCFVLLFTCSIRKKGFLKTRELSSGIHLFSRSAEIWATYLSWKQASWAKTKPIVQTNTSPHRIPIESVVAVAVQMFQHYVGQSWECSTNQAEHSMLDAFIVNWEVGLDVAVGSWMLGTETKQLWGCVYPLF